MKLLSLLPPLFVASLASASNLHPEFERALSNEHELQKNIVTGILDIQAKNKSADGKLLRGTHSKGVCAKAHFEVFSQQQSNNLHVGLFSKPAIYPATVRFANAASKIQSDFEDDVRSMSFSVENVDKNISNDYGRMDFSTNNATTFPINDAFVFSSLMTLSMEGPMAGGFKVGLSGITAAGQALLLGKLQQKPASTAYQKMRYWSGVPFLLGNNQAIKYALTPCATNRAGTLDKKNVDALTSEFVRSVNAPSEEICFDFQIQILDVNRAFVMHSDGISEVKVILPAYDWVENATWEWSEDQMPFTTVGRLHITKNSVLPTVQCEQLRFNVNKYTSELHRGLGSINRARTQAEQASAENRLGKK